MRCGPVSNKHFSPVSFAVGSQLAGRVTSLRGTSTGILRAVMDEQVEKNARSKASVAMERVPVDMWYLPSRVAADLRRAHGIRRTSGFKPLQCASGYDQDWTFVGRPDRKRPFSLDDQMAFDQSLTAYVRRLGVSRWQDRHNVSNEGASIELAKLQRHAQVVGRCMSNSQPGSLLSPSQLADFIDDVVASKPLPFYEEHQRRYDKHQLSISVTAALSNVTVPNETVRGWLNVRLDDFSDVEEFRLFASKLVSFSQEDSVRHQLENTAYNLRVFVFPDQASVRCDLIGRDDGHLKLSLAFRSERAAVRRSAFRSEMAGDQWSFSVEYLLTSIGANGQGGARWPSWRKLVGEDLFVAATATIVACAKARRCRGVCQADCAEQDESDARGWRAVESIGRHNIRSVRTGVTSSELPVPVGVRSGGPMIETMRTRGASSAPAPEATPQGLSPSPALEQGSSRKTARFAPTAAAPDPALMWYEGCESIWRSPLCMLVYTEVRTAEALAESKSLRCPSCAADGQRLLSTIRRAVATQAGLSGKAPAAKTNVARKLETPGRALAAFNDVSEQLRFQKACTRRLEEANATEGIQLSDKYADVVEKAVAQVDALTLKDIDESQLKELGLVPVCALVSAPVRSSRLPSPRPGVPLKHRLASPAPHDVKPRTPYPFTRRRRVQVTMATRTRDQRPEPGADPLARM